MQDPNEDGRKFFSVLDYSGFLPPKQSSGKHIALTFKNKCAQSLVVFAPVLKIDYGYTYRTHGTWPFFTSIYEYDITFNNQHSYPDECGIKQDPSQAGQQVDDQNDYSINMVRKTVNLPNYWQLLGVGTIGKHIFGADDDKYKVVRWETTDGTSDINNHHRRVMDLKFKFHFVMEK